MDQPNLEGLRTQVQQPLAEFCTRLQEELGGHLVSLTVVGSSLTNDFVPGRSDINTVLVIDGYDRRVFESLAAMGKHMGRKGLQAPLIMTAAYIDRSRDVFPIEWLDFQLNHRTVLGADPFADVQFDRADVRLQCERELKSLLVKMRQGYIRSGNKADQIAKLLGAATAEMLPVLRGLLWLKGLDRPVEAEPVFEAVAKSFSLDANRLKTAHWLEHRKLRISTADVIELFWDMYGQVDQLTTEADTMEVGQ